MAFSRIYLDFDGVLHRRPAVAGPFEHLEAFETVLRDYPDTEVVISSSWREGYSFEEMRDWFAPDVQHQVIGVTPLLQGALRIAEIQADLAARPCLRYRILDDDSREFPAEHPNLHLCETSTGLAGHDFAALRAWLALAAVPP